MFTKVPPEPLHIAHLMHALACEYEKGIDLGKIDWAKLLELVTQLLPLILSFFAEEARTRE